VGQINSALSHHFHEIPKTEFEPEIPTHAEDDDLAVEMAALEEIINAGHPGSLPLMLRSAANMLRFCCSHQSLRFGLCPQHWG
jgi:hypothetical protein